jgi:hemerythrin-like metal-binding protein
MSRDTAIQSPLRRSRVYLYWIAAIALTVVIFLIDLQLPLGVAGGVPYVVVVLMAWWLPNSRDVVVLALITSVLTLIGYAHSPSGGIPWIVITNRSLALFAIWTVTILIIQRKQAEMEIINARDDLEITVSKRTAELEEKSSHLEAVLSSISQGLVAYDKDLKLIISNTRFQEIRGVPEEITLLGSSFADWVKFDVARGEFGENDPERTVLEQIARAKKFSHHNFERTRPNGTVVEIEGGPLPKGGFVSTFTDITERKETERIIADAMRKIHDSIEYASYIQKSILPDDSVFKSVCSDHFVLWMPRDTVGGDMYWHRYWGNGNLIILGDCTGHGVPGAFMTLISNGALDEAYMETAPGDTAGLLQRMHVLIQSVLGQDKEEGLSDDGIDLGAIYLAPERNKLTFSGARFSLFISSDGDVKEIKGNKSGLGYRGISRDPQFTNHGIDLHSEDRFYMTSDGFIDQVGGDRNLSFGKKRFRALLAQVSQMNMDEQKQKIVETLADYQGDQIRRDDVSVLGLVFKDSDATQEIGERANEPLFEFDAQYSVGFSEIDEDHKKLFNLVIWFSQAIEGARQEEITRALNELVDYTDWHFRHEERLMQEHHYPELDQHVFEHNDLRKKVKVVVSRFENGEMESLDGVPEFLTNWLIHHIKVTDQKLGEYLSKDK